MQSFASNYLTLIDHPNKLRIENLLHIMESWPYMILMIHRFDSQITYTSHQVKNVLGYQKTVWNNDFLSSLTHEDDIYCINEKMASYLMEANKPFYDKEGPHILKLFGRLRQNTGKYVPIEFSGTIIEYDEKGGFHLGIGVYQDISPRNGNPSQKETSERLTSYIEKNLSKIKKLYLQMHPAKPIDSAHLIHHKGISKIHIVDTEQLSIKNRYGVEIQKILTKKISMDSHQMLMDTEPGNITQFQFVNKVIHCIEQHLENFEFTTHHLASELHMSRGNLYRKIKHRLNISPGELIKQIRLNKAANLLKLTEESITNIAFSVGFPDPSYFSKCFQGQFGITPLAYRKGNQPSLTPSS